MSNFLAKNGVIYLPDIDGAIGMPKMRVDGMSPTAVNDALPGAPIDVADWDSLFGAVEERLRSTVETLDTAPMPLARQANLSRIKSVVLDCVSAMETLHQSLKQERRTHTPSEANGAASDAAVASSLTGGQGTIPNN
jgi:hypothetical protein